jgi:hypothetical protein
MSPVEKASDDPRTIHVVIPDTQTTPNTPTVHLEWIGQYITDKFVGRPKVTLIHVGDHWDFPSLSSYDKGKRQMEGRRYILDVEAGNKGFDKLCWSMEEYNRKHLKKQWNPDKRFLLGNHEQRVERACMDNAQLDGTIGYHQLNAGITPIAENVKLQVPHHGWRVHDFLEPVNLDGVFYSHYFLNPANGNPVAGMIETRIKTIGQSFTQGHMQGLRSGMLETFYGRKRGLVCGSCYLHNEEYRGPQGTNEWRGIVVCYNVKNGDYDLKEVSLDSLCRRYEGISLVEWVKRYYPDGWPIS